jgi:hypothetical protein
VSEIFIRGRLLGKTSISTTAKGGSMGRSLVECEFIRKIRDRYVAECHVLPVVSFGFQAEQLAGLPSGTMVSLGCRLNGTVYTPPTGGETRHGLQLITESIALEQVYRPAPVRELPA